MYTTNLKASVVLFVGIVLCIYRCGKSFDDSAAELGLVFNDPTVEGRPNPSFGTNVSPILIQRCALTGCHIADGPEDVDLRTYATLQKGGEHDAIVIPGNAKESEFVEGKMPPEGPPLEASEIQLIIDWVNEGQRKTKSFWHRWDNLSSFKHNCRHSM